jgi:hypothetical protein
MENSTIKEIFKKLQEDLIIDAIDLKTEGKIIGQMVESVQEELYKYGKYAQKRENALIKEINRLQEELKNSKLNKTYSQDEIDSWNAQGGSFGVGIGSDLPNDSWESMGR